jgi:uncharacterized protein (DUF1330 family)
VKSIEPSDDQLQAFAALAEAEGPDPSSIVMINLLRYRDEAAYPEGFDAAPCSGREAYARYGAVALPRIASVGGRILFMGAAEATVIGPSDECWDDAVLVEYPSRQSFLEMVSQPEYLAAAPHRTAALEDSRLIATGGQWVVSAA